MSNEKQEGRIKNNVKEKQQLGCDSLWKSRLQNRNERNVMLHCYEQIQYVGLIWTCALPSNIVFPRQISSSKGQVHISVIFSGEHMMNVKNWSLHKAYLGFICIDLTLCFLNQLKRHKKTHSQFLEIFMEFCLMLC